MSRSVLDISNDTLLALKMTPDEAGTTLRLAAAIKSLELADSFPVRQHN